jgi:hypothetical protein
LSSRFARGAQRLSGQGGTSAGQTKTPDLIEARGARIAQGQGQPPLRLTPGLDMAGTARCAVRMFTDCLLSVVTRLANPAATSCNLSSAQTAPYTCIISTDESQPLYQD